MGESKSPSRTKPDVGVPQGGVLSPLLFLIYCSDISFEHILGCKLYLYADDIALVATSRDKHALQAAVQKGLDYLGLWATVNNMEFSPAKSAVLLFTRTKIHSTPRLSINGTAVPAVEKFCYLGVTFDTSLSWTHHVNYLIGNLKSRANFVNAICLSKRGAPFSVATQLVRAVVISKLDYGCLLYREAPAQLLKKLDTALHCILRKILGCLKSTPLPAIYCELGLTTLETRMKKLEAQYFTRKMLIPNDIIYKELIETYDQNQRFQPKSIPPYCRMVKHISETAAPIPTPDVIDEVGSASSTGIKSNIALPPFSRGSPEEPPEMARARWHEWVDQWTQTGHRMVFTDGSCFATGGGAAVVVLGLSHALSFKVTEKLSIFSLELHALLKAFEFIASVLPVGKYLICSDSLSVLNYLMYGHRPARKSVLLLENILLKLMTAKYEIVATWVPAHVGIRGNEQADKLAKWGARYGENLVCQYSVNDFLCYYDKLLKEKEKEVFGQRSQNRILDLYDYGTPPPDLCHPVRHLAISIFRLRTGHARIRSVLFKWKSVDSPLCEVCNVEEDVRHILMYCKKYERQRLPLKKACLKYFGAFTLRSILGHAQAPPWARKKSVEVLGRFIVDTKLHLEL